MFQHRKLRSFRPSDPPLNGFNGAGVFQHRKPSNSKSPAHCQFALQWSRCVSTPETVLTEDAAPPIIPASMEPVCFNTGNFVSGVLFDRLIKLASMEPVCFNTGNNVDRGTNGHGYRRFNGAGVFQHRKHAMHKLFSVLFQKLQWSRCVSTPETTKPSRVRPA